MYGSEETLCMCRQSLARWIGTGRSIQQFIALRILAQVESVTKEIGLVSVFKSYLQGVKIREFLLEAYLEGIRSFSGLSAHIPVESVSELMPL